MATRANSQQPGRQTTGYRSSSSSDSMGMGVSNSTILAKEDANRFLTGLLIMLVVFAMILPLIVIVYIDVLAIKVSLKEEVSQLRKLKKELETQKEK